MFDILGCYPFNFHPGIKHIIIVVILAMAQRHKTTNLSDVGLHCGLSFFLFRERVYWWKYLPEPLL